MKIRGRWPLALSVVTAFLLTGSVGLQPTLNPAWGSASAVNSGGNSGAIQTAQLDGEPEANSTTAPVSGNTPEEPSSSAETDSAGTESTESTPAELTKTKKAETAAPAATETAEPTATETAEPAATETAAPAATETAAPEEAPKATAGAEPQEPSANTADTDEGPVSKEEVDRLVNEAPPAGDSQPETRVSSQEEEIIPEDTQDAPEKTETGAPLTLTEEAAPAEDERKLQQRIAELQTQVEAMQSRQALELKQRRDAETLRQQGEKSQEQLEQDRQANQRDAHAQRIAALQRKIDRLENNSPKTRPAAAATPGVDPGLRMNMRGSSGDDDDDPWRRTANAGPKATAAPARPAQHKPPPLPQGLVVNSRTAPGGRAVPRNPNAGFASVLSRVAATASASGNHATAVKMYRRAMRLTPERVEPALGLGRALSALGDHEGAIAASRAVLKIDPANPDAQLFLGKSLMALDLPHQAIPHLEFAAGRRNNPRLYNDLGVAQDMVGDADSAQAYYRSGLKFAGDDLALMSNLGISLALGGKFHEAIPLLQRAANHPAANVRHRENLAFAHVLAGDRRSARQVSLRDLSPGDVEARLEYYAMLARTNRSGERKAVVTVLAGRKHSLSDVAEAHRRLRVAAGIPAKAPVRIVEDQKRRSIKSVRKTTPPPAAVRPPARRAPQTAARDAPGWNVGAEDETPSAPPLANMVLPRVAPVQMGPPAPVATVPSTENLERPVAAARPRISPRTPRRIASIAPTANSGAVGAVRYQVQLGAYIKPWLAERGWRRLSRAAPDLFGQRDHFIREPNPDFSWDRLHRLRTPARTGHEEAAALCAALRARAMECLVVESRYPGAQPAVANNRPGAQRRTRDVATMETPEVLRARRGNRPSPAAVAAAAAGRQTDAPALGIRPRGNSGMTASRTAGPRFVYEVQLAAYRRRAHAVRGWRILRRAAPDLLGDVGHGIKAPNTLMRADRLYRLRTAPYPDPMHARMLCRLLRDRNIDCLVVRTTPHGYNAASMMPTVTRAAVQKNPLRSRAVEVEPLTLPEDRPAPNHVAPLASTPAPRPAARTAPARRTTYELQLGAYRDRKAAERNVQEFAEAAPDVATDLDVTVRRGESANMYLLRSRPLKNRHAAEEICSELNARMLNCVVLESLPRPRPRAKAATAPPVQMSAAASQATPRTRATRSGEAFQVQFSAHRTPADALKKWQKLKHAVPQFLDKTDFVITASTPAGGFITQYRLRTLAFSSWDGANALCKNLRQNSIACRVVITEDPASLLGDIGYAPAPQRAPRAAQAAARDFSPNALTGRATTRPPGGHAASQATPSRLNRN